MRYSVGENPSGDSSERHAHQACHVFGHEEIILEVSLAESGQGRFELHGWEDRDGNHWIPAHRKVENVGVDCSTGGKGMPMVP